MLAGPGLAMALAALANETIFAYLAVIAGAGVMGDVITATHLNSLRLSGARWTLESAHPAGLAQRSTGNARSAGWAEDRR